MCVCIYINKCKQKHKLVPDFGHVSRYREKLLNFLDIPIYEDLITFKAHRRTARCFETSL